MRRIETFFLKVILFGLLWISLVSDAPGADETEDAANILQATGVRGGLVVHLGCGDGKLTAALGAEDGYLVHGLGEANWNPACNISIPPHGLIDERDLSTLAEHRLETGCLD